MAHGWHAGECYTYGCRVTYHCADGFELVGRSDRHCQADGSWSPKELPACVRKLHSRFLPATRIVQPKCSMGISNGIFEGYLTLSGPVIQFFKEVCINAKLLIVNSNVDAT